MERAVIEVWQRFAGNWATLGSYQIAARRNLLPSPKSSRLRKPTVEDVAAHQGLRAQPTGFSIEAAFSEAVCATREQKSVSLLKRAQASHADCR
jgi:hypothetical protein